MDLLRRLEHRLGLTEEQREKINVLVQESQDRMRALWEPVAPKARAEFERLHELIAAELTPEQREKYEALLKERPSKSSWRHRRVPCELLEHLEDKLKRKPNYEHSASTAPGSSK